MKNNKPFDCDCLEYLLGKDPVSLEETCEKDFDRFYNRLRDLCNQLGEPTLFRSLEDDFGACCADSSDLGYLRGKEETVFLLNWLGVL